MLAKKKSIKRNKDFMKYFYNTNWLFIEKIFQLGVSFFVGIYIAKYLGPEKFGMINYALSFIALTTIFASIEILW